MIRSCSLPDPINVREIERLSSLDDALDDLEVIGVRQLGQLVHRRLGRGPVPLRHVNQDRAGNASGGLGSLHVAIEFALERADQLREVVVDLARPARREEPVALAARGDILDFRSRSLSPTATHGRDREDRRVAAVAAAARGAGSAVRSFGRRKEMGDANGTRLPIILDRDDRHGVEAVERQRGQFLGTEWGVLQPRGHEPQRAETHAPGRRAGLPGNRHPTSIPDGDGLDAAGAIDEQAEPAVQRLADRGHLTGQLAREDGALGDPSSVEALEAVLFCRRQSEQVAVQGRNERTPPGPGSAPCPHRYLMYSQSGVKSWPLPEHMRKRFR